MQALLKLSDWIDTVGQRLASLASWTVLLAALISAGNAFVRYGVDWSSNSLLEIQWYLFAWMVMVGAPFVLKVNEHVRVDLVYGKLKGHQPVWVDLFGLVFFLLPVMLVLLWLTWPYFWRTFVTGEMSQNAGGLVRWPAVAALPVGFALMVLQAVSEIIKRVAHIRGVVTLDLHYEKPLQ